MAIIADEARTAHAPEGGQPPAAIERADGKSCAHTPLLPAQDTITGFLLAGVGNIDLRRKSNFLIVDQSQCGARALLVGSLPVFRLGLTRVALQKPRRGPSRRRSRTSQTGMTLRWC